MVATRTTCPRRAVGCVITDEYNHIMATGFNGVPQTFPHCTEFPCGGEKYSQGEGLSECMAIHAETNALLQCHDSMKIKTIYCTLMPCIDCAKLIGNTSCKRIVYSEEYLSKASNLLKKLNIKLEQLPLIIPKITELSYDGSGRAYPPNPEDLSSWDKTYEFEGKYYELVGDYEHKEWSEVEAKK